MVWTILSLQWINGALYLDPGTGSILLQLLVGVLMGGLLAVKIYWKKIKAFFTKEPPQSTESSDNLEEDPTDEN
jgi:hypothetical protein